MRILRTLTALLLALLISFSAFSEEDQCMEDWVNAYNTAAQTNGIIEITKDDYEYDSEYDAYYVLLGDDIELCVWFDYTSGEVFALAAAAPMTDESCIGVMANAAYVCGTDTEFSALADILTEVTVSLDDAEGKLNNGWSYAIELVIDEGVVYLMLTLEQEVLEVEPEPVPSPTPGAQPSATPTLPPKVYKA